MPQDIASTEKPDIQPVGYELDDLYTYLEDERLDAIEPARLSITSPYVVSQFLGRLDVDDRRKILRLIPLNIGTDIVAEMDAEDAADVLEAMREGRAVQILEDLDPDDSADIVAELEDDDQQRLLKAIDPETAATVRELIEYDQDSAGGIMTPEVAKVFTDMTVTEAVGMIQKLDEELEHIYYIYVVDHDDQLLGIVSMRDLVMAKGSDVIGDIMTTELRGIIPVDMDQEEVAHEMAEHNFHALPVVDENKRLIGIVTDDDIIDIIQEEATEDLQKMMGAGGDETLGDPIVESVRRRTPWLVVNLVSAFFAGGVIAMFEHQIHQLTILAVCMPIVASLGGNTGGQSLAVVIRSLALGDVHRGESRDVCLREGFKGLLNGVLIGIIAAAVIWAFTGEAIVGGVVLLAMILSMTYAGTVGAFIPIILKRMGLDPAQSSQMFLTASTDIVGFAVFLGLGAWLLL
ncbi:magnesium transporter [Rubellicoccus peritrichatus]|uniref:Magnesium transporter MgtE n=1 Tax=Rubellicoccus peritrichatus TaxID=3080537 RepID=A0AAQ3LC12_9BACT|nr:magnesium transporter [Puniceicoccus sp. CR14]WOO40708.1 magnesium transporter [Puniceicoccus sp. CR14]